MENNSYESAKWSASSSPYMLSSSDWSAFNLPFSSSSSDNFPAADDGADRAESLSRSHRLAEKRRRDRINSHLSALRKLVPNSDKLDKAALLATVMEQVKELKQKASESPIFHELPTETDEVTVQPEILINSELDAITEKSINRVIFRASFCCEDHPEALSEIIRAVNKLQFETIRADIVCVGGRMRNNFIVKESNDHSFEHKTVAEAAKALKQSLHAALNRIAGSSSSSSTSVCRIRSKRQRWFLSSHYSQ